ncbi:hypothetical protein BRC99_03925 [Halobacteriales archaeon QS_7_69_60]|nr:MAG: hypothetical protein BRC99_03925 [Halobacteriales archaeon QS_7_69_60]
MANITLYELPGCPYCAKVIDKLDELGLEYDSIEVPRNHDDRVPRGDLRRGRLTTASDCS